MIGGIVAKGPTIKPVQISGLLNSLKFRIVALAALSGIGAALGTATVVLDATQAQMQRLLLATDRDIANKTRRCW